MGASTSFHESYYAHNCPIIPEKDVLYTDISGTGMAVNLRRCWNDLFLLSTTNEISRGFYNSSNAMRIERFRQFRKYRSRNHPMSKFSYFWNHLILMMFIIDKILFRFTSSIVFENIPIYFNYIGAVAELFIVFDLFVNFKTGYIDEQMKKVVLDTKKCLYHYCSTKLFLHCISIIPLHWFLFLKFGYNVDCGLCKASKFICALKMFSALGLYRIFEISACWTRKRYSPNTVQTLRCLRIGILGFISMMLFYDVVDAVFIVHMKTESEVDGTSFIGQLLLLRYGIMKNIPNHLVLCFDISRIFKSLLLYSFGVKNSEYVLDKLSSVIAYLIASGFFAWSVLECHSLICRIYYPMDRLMKRRHSVINIIESNQLSDDIKIKVNEYFDFKPTQLAITNLNNSLYENIAPVLRKEIILNCNRRLLLRIPLFNKWPLPIVHDLAMMLKEQVYLKNDVLIEVGTEIEGMMILDSGVLAVYAMDQSETGHLIDGDYFGELSLVADLMPLLSYVVAVDTCRTLLLDKTDFRSYMKRYPVLFTALKEKLLKGVNLNPDTERVSGK